jgi:hypothetical protein
LHKILLLLLPLLLQDAYAQVLTSSNLPIVVVNTGGQGIPNEPRVRAQMRIYYKGEGQRNSISDLNYHYNGLVGIEVRGQSSQGFPMKSYDLELWNTDSTERTEALMGFPRESDFILYAPYTDKTLMRNFLAYSFTREMGRWAARCRYVEVVVDNDYKGIYVFMEKIKRDSARVNIPKLGRNENSGDAVTGGYIVSIDKGANGWLSNLLPLQGSGGQRIRYNYVYPRIDSITTPQRNYIKSYVDSFEQAVGSSQYQDPQEGWRRFADESSFIDYLIVNELARNVDGYRISTYLHKDKQSNGGKLLAGPVWDYDLGFYNANYCRGSDSSGWAWQFNGTCPNDGSLVPAWWDRFFRDTSFLSNLRCRWLQVRQSTLSNTRINKLIDSVVTLTQEARFRHFTRWPVLGQYIWPNMQPVPTSYPSEIIQLKNWFTKRIDWIEQNLPNQRGCVDLPPTAFPDLTLQPFPNPFRGELNLRIRSQQIRPADLLVYDVRGRLLHQSKLYLNYGENRRTLNTSTWPAGLYFVRLLDASGQGKVMRVVKN